jgi:hypothetical protein
MAEFIRTHTGDGQPSSAVVISLHQFEVEMYSGDTTGPCKSVVV